MSETAIEMTPDLIAEGSSMARVARAAKDAGLEIRILKMAQSTRTAEEAAEAAGCDVSQIVKSLVFENTSTKKLELMLVSGSHNADMDYISERYGLSFARCDVRRVREETGFAIGGVAPIGHLSPIRIYMDRTLLDHERVWAAAGRPDSVFSVDPKALASAIGAEPIYVRAPS
jgi:prolyl-tRNA editing enzyme YbaK/EbsC (Cys-tRNA(Pro) deacylase)